MLPFVVKLQEVLADGNRGTKRGIPRYAPFRLCVKGPAAFSGLDSSSGVGGVVPSAKRIKMAKCQICADVNSMRHSNEEDNSQYHSPVLSNVQARPAISIWWSRRCCIACLIYLGSELVLMHADLAILCDLEGSIVAATTFLRTQLPCIDCCCI
jgi:hypothetical protein